MPLYKTLADFGELLPAEEKVRARMAEDEFVDIDETARIGGPVPAIGAAAHKIRAEFVAFLARGGAKGAEPPPRGLYIQGAWIAGPLDLRGPAIDRDLALVACRFDAPPNLMSARLANLYLNGSHLPDIDADRLEAKGSVFLRQATVEGKARLLGARLGGNLVCDGARFSRKHGPALNADGLEAKGGVFLRQATVEGEARFLGARLGGDLDCDDARFSRKHGTALNADGLEAKGGVFLNQATVEGEARFPGAWLGVLVCEHARFSRKDGHALIADGLEVKGGVFLSQATVEGEARFLGARLGGDLVCIGAQFENAGRGALSLHGARVAGALFLRDGARLRGCLAMTGASFGHINDDRDCWPGPGDLILNRCRYEAFTGGPVDARSRLEWLALQDPSRFGKDFWPQPYEQLAKVFREMGHSGDARAVLVEKEKLQRAERRAALRSNLIGARLRRKIERASDTALPERLAEAKLRLEAHPPNSPMRRRLFEQIAAAHVFEPLEDVSSNPPFDMERLVVDPRRRDPAYGYEALHWRKWAVLPLLSLWDWMLGVTVGYGRRPYQAALCLLGFLLLGTLVFAAAAEHHAIKPNQPFVLRSDEWAMCAEKLPDDLAAKAEMRRARVEDSSTPTQLDCFRAQPEAAQYPAFNALVYSLDTLLPIVSLEMQGFWIPDETKSPGLPWHERIGWWARVYLWFHIAVGWGLSLLAVAGFSGLVKSD